jgi:hypothetical protein
MKRRNGLVWLLLAWPACRGPKAEVVEGISSAATYTVGPGGQYAELSAVPDLAPGDVVQVAWRSTPYAAVVFHGHGDVGNPAIIQGLRSSNGQRPVIAGSGQACTEGMPLPDAVRLELTDNVTFQGFEVKLGPCRCIFDHAANVTIKDSVVHDCPNGILEADEDSGSLTMDRVEVHHCGISHGQNAAADNCVYIATDEAQHPGSVFRMQYSYVHDTGGGVAVKTRAERNELYYNWIEGNQLKELELIGPVQNNQLVGDPREDGDVVGNVIRQVSGGDPDNFVVRVGDDGNGQSKGRYRFVNNTFTVSSGWAPSAGVALFWSVNTVDSMEMHNNAFYREGGGTINLLRIDNDAGTTPPVVTGTHNWVPTGSTAPGGWTGTLSGSAPGFGSYPSDLHPLGTSALIDAGQANPPTNPSHPFPSPLGTPASEPPLRSIAFSPTAARVTGGPAIDIGAFEACPSVGSTWISRGFSAQSGPFTVEFDATPNTQGTNAVVGLSTGEASSYQVMPAIVRFYFQNPDLTRNDHIDARDYDHYASASGNIPYTAGNPYHFKMYVPSVASRQYDAWVTAPGGSPQQLGAGWRFRDSAQQTPQPPIDHWNMHVDNIEGAGGSIRVCNFVMNPN